MIGKSLQLESSSLSSINKIVISSLLCFFVMLLGCSRSLFIVYMPDDFLLASQNMPMSFYLNQGRFVQAIITGFFNYTHINIVSSSPIFTPLFFVSTSIAASLTVTKLLPKDSGLIATCLLSSVVVSHPVFSMMAVYHLAVVCFSLCMLCVIGFIITFDNFVEKCDFKSGFYSSIFIVLICGNYQPAFVVAMIFSLVKLYKQDINLISLSNFKRSLPIIFGVVIYALLFKVTKNIAGENTWDSRAGLVTDIHGRLSDIASLLPNFFYSNWWVIPKQYSLLLTTSVLLFLFTHIFKFKRLRLSSLAVPIIMLLVIILPISLLKAWDPTPRALFSVSFFYVAVIIVFYNEGLRKTKIIILSMSLLMGLLSSNNYLYLTEMSQKQDKILILNAYNAIKKSEQNNKRLTLVNDGAISVDFWAVNGLFYFLTNERLNITPPEESDIEACSNRTDKIQLVETNNANVICISR